MPQYHTRAGTVSLPDAKSSYPTFPKVGFDRAVAIGIDAGFLCALLQVQHLILEQLLTHRPNSYVPVRTMGNHLGVSADFYSRYFDLLNNLHHYGMGMLAGPMRAIMSCYGVIGPVATFIHAGIRIMMDQTVELTAGTSALP
ncbi:hypothetical protein CC86DRAFT_292008 [Ophiobolus disseminans]|uniref:Uncharacterized protein n=1 Tax=Ophiobolus disseminans TaxID=1469910 RepID=A0A6A7A1H0_9PLEO|nr:hypothetical protein CC86DRAFT_292008 [Ophiobolus disseminans]